MSLATAESARADDWPSRGLGISNQRLSAERIGATFAGTRWAFPLPNAGATVASPAVADGYLVFGAFDGVVRAVGAVDGKLRWQKMLGDGVYATPVIHRGRVFLPAVDKHLYALSLLDGKTLWKKDIGGLAMGSPVMSDGALIVAAGFPERAVFKIDADTGATLWQSAPEILAQFSNSSAAVSGDQVIIGANGGHYYSFDLATGALRWTYEAVGIVNLSAPVVLGGRVYILPGGRTRTLHAVDLATGLAVPGWPVELPTTPADIEGVSTSREHAVSSLAAADGRIVLDFRIDDSLDNNADGNPDRFLMREYVLAVDAATGKVLWQQGNGRSVVTDAIVMPKFWLCPTPALWNGSQEGGALLAVASTLTATLRVLDPATGAEITRVTTAGPAQISPIVANGRLFVGAHGVIEGLLSSVNQPPLAPILLPSSNDELTKDGVTLHWAAAVDANDDAVTYQVRLDRDGEVLRSWTREAITEAGATGVRLDGTFEMGVTYNVAVRARDLHGAWSDWSLTGTFALKEPAPAQPDPGPQPPTVDPVAPATPADLFSALERARSGDVITIGAGNFPLTKTLRIPGGVTLKGAGPGRTLLHAQGLSVGVAIEGSSPGTPSQLSRLTVTGAVVGISVRDTEGARISNIILRDNTQAGIEVHAGASAHLSNGTLLRNGNAVMSHGSILVKNSIITGSQVGFWSNAQSNITSRFNDVWGNTLDYRSAEPGLGDLGMEVHWVDSNAGDLHLLPRQPSTDRGDPADDFSAEPAPNGGRINLGAFGGTDEAETSAEAAGQPVTTPVASGDDGGCAFAGTKREHGPAQGLWMIGALLALLGVRRSRRG